MFQSSTVFGVIASTEVPQPPSPSDAMTVTCPASPPSPASVMRTPGTSVEPIWKAWSCKWPCVGSDRLHVAGVPSAVTAGTENVCPAALGMNAEYMGEKMIGTVGFEHDPASVLTAPASTAPSMTGPSSPPPPELPPPSDTVPSTPAPPPSCEEPDGLSEELEPEHAAKPAAPAARTTAESPSCARGKAIPIASLQRERNLGAGRACGRAYA